jgi:hypothetical protein
MATEGGARRAAVAAIASIRIEFIETSSHSSRARQRLLSQLLAKERLTAH